MKKTGNTVRIINANPFAVVVHGINRSYRLDRARDGAPQQFIELAFEEVEHINTRSDVFRNGTLLFPEAVAKEVHIALQNHNWEDTVISDEDIKAALLTPSADVLRKIIGSTSIFVVERYRGELVRLKNEGKHGISDYVTYIINERYRELSRNINKSQITLDVSKLGIDIERKAAESALIVENLALSAKLEELEKTVAEMKAAQKTAAKTKAVKNTDE